MIGVNTTLMSQYPKLIADGYWYELANLRKFNHLPHEYTDTKVKKQLSH